MALTACHAGAGRVATPSALVNDPCLVSPEVSPTRDTITVALMGPLRAGGDTLPVSPAERFLSGHLGDAIGIDCQGNTRNALLEKFRLAATDPLTLVPVLDERTGPVLIVRPIAPDADLRDQIDAGNDVVITADAATLDYAGRRGGLRLVPLAWSTAYVLVTPEGSALPVQATSSLRAELARDAVRAEARPAESSGPWEERCAIPQVGTGVRHLGIAIPEGDPVARALAERLVALAPRSGPSRVISYAPPDLNAVLAAGAAVAFVLPLPRQLRFDCRTLFPIPARSTIAPLIEVRSTAVLRPGVPAFLITADGTVRFFPAARR